MTPNDMLVLKKLAEDYDDEWVPFYNFVSLQAATKLTRREVRLSARRLARKGLAQYSNALWDDSCGPRGAGYACTNAGIEFLKNAGEEK